MRYQKTAFVTFVLITFFMSCSILALAGEQGHYFPGVMGIRDLDQPPKGVYFAVYNFYYHSGNFQDADGHKFDSLSLSRSVSGSRTTEINLRGGRSIPIRLTANAEAKLDADLELQLDMVFHQPSLVWAPGFKILGADYAALVGVPFGYVRIDAEADATLNVAAAATVTTGGITVTPPRRGSFEIGGISKSVSASASIQRSAEIEDNKYGFGDMLVQPVWLQWSDYKNYSAGTTYSFYAPTGAYDEGDIANVGLGFWTHQWQIYGYYYLLNGATAFHYRTTYELHSYKYDKDVRPGQNMTIEYGLSQYLHERFAVGVLGYHQWQISDDSGRSAVNKDVHDRLNGIGGEINFWPVKGKLLVAVRCSAEYGNVDRFQGILGAINITWAFGEPIPEKLKKRQMQKIA